jgi:hypothetical protein
MSVELTVHLDEFWRMAELIAKTGLKVLSHLAYLLIFYQFSDSTTKIRLYGCLSCQINT